jgi:A/G-specific adenine glycosylase
MTTSRHLLVWYRRSARSLPWRSEPRDPYQVLVSELMLQQTQVDRVVPRFASFIARFPSLKALASASEEEVLAEWSGLGYYRRARMLWQLARELDGAPLPATRAGLERLPGVGPYTAAAIASLAFDRCEPVLDGNVMRVASRVLAFAGNPRSAAARQTLGDWVRSLMPGQPPGAINEALMELGALICLPKAPACDRCPLAEACRGHAIGDPESFPRPRPTRAAVEMQWVAACLIDQSGGWMLRRIEEGTILRGLWLPPLASLGPEDDPVGVAQALVPWTASGRPVERQPVRHAITYRRITVTPVQMPVGSVEHCPDGWQRVDPVKPELPTSSLLAKLVKACAGE